MQTPDRVVEVEGVTGEEVLRQMSSMEASEFVTVSEDDVYVTVDIGRSDAISKAYERANERLMAIEGRFGSVLSTILAQLETMVV